MGNKKRPYDSVGIKSMIRDFEISFCRKNRGEEVMGPEFRYKDFHFSSDTTRERGKGLELRVDICSLEDKQKAKRLLEYTKWFKDWDILSAEENKSGINPSAIRNLPDLEKLKGYISFSESREEHPGMIRIYYSLNKPFLEEDGEDFATKRRAWRALMIALLFSGIDYLSK